MDEFFQDLRAAGIGQELIDFLATQGNTIPSDPSDYPEGTSIEDIRTVLQIFGFSPYMIDIFVASEDDLRARDMD